MSIEFRTSVVTIPHGTGRQLPRGVLQVLVEEFLERLSVLAFSPGTDRISPTPYLDAHPLCTLASIRDAHRREVSDLVPPLRSMNSIA